MCRNFCFRCLDDDSFMLKKNRKSSFHYEIYELHGNFLLFLLFSFSFVKSFMVSQYQHQKFPVKPCHQLHLCPATVKFNVFSQNSFSFLVYGLCNLFQFQEALDGIEFARGDSDSTWGAIRAAMGHPEPFDLKYVAVGNEDCGKKNYRGLHYCVLLLHHFLVLLCAGTRVNTCTNPFASDKESNLNVYRVSLYFKLKLVFVISHCNDRCHVHILIFTCFFINFFFKTFEKIVMGV